MSEEQNGKSASNEVSKDTVYSELYIEMRRFRDYELTASTWYTAILSAILVALLSVKFGAGATTQLSEFLSRYQIIRIFLVISVALIGFSGFFSVLHVARRYDKLRDYVDDNLEPKWKKNFRPPKRGIFAPSTFIMVTLALVTITTALLLWLI